MKKLFLFLSTLLLVTTLEAQTKSVLTEIHVNEFVYKGDSMYLPVPKVISVNKLGCSTICSIGKINNSEFGIQLETMLSQLNNAERLVVGMVIYKRDGTGWQALLGPQYQEKTYYIQTDGKGANQTEFGYAGNSYEDVFHIDYSERYTLIK